MAAEIAGRFGYDLSRSLDEIRPGYKFSSRCDDTVPLAFRAVLEADGYEDAARRVISVGGDTDTTACMAGAIAGAYWGIPGFVAEAVETRLDQESLAIVRTFEQQYPAAARFAG